MSAESGKTFNFNVETNFAEIQLLVAPESIKACTGWRFIRIET